MLAQILPAESWHFVLVFVRISVILILFPAIGQSTVPPQVRAILSLLLTFLLAPALAPLLPILPDNTGDLLLMVTAEILVGITIGTSARFIMDGLVYLGAFMAYLSGLSNAALFNPLQAQQSILPSLFYSLTGTTLLFATQLHHLLFMALASSYQVFPPGVFFPIGDFTTYITHMLSGSFRLGLQMSIPFMVIQMVFMAFLGVMARLMPQFSVFFVALPMQILIGLALMFVTLGSVMTVFLGHFQAEIAVFIPGL
jgi:flagellar biosynthetic protein FliR